jgi:hypothetical protein
MFGLLLCFFNGFDKWRSPFRGILNAYAVKALYEASESALKKTYDKQRRCGEFMENDRRHPAGKFAKDGSIFDASKKNARMENARIKVLSQRGQGNPLPYPSFIHKKPEKTCREDEKKSKEPNGKHDHMVSRGELPH